MGKLLEELAGEGERGRIFRLEAMPDGRFRIEERCDGYYYAYLTADELRALGQELFDFANEQSTGERGK